MPCLKAIWNSSINCCLFLQPDGTDLCHFVHGHETWADYLTYMEQDSAWGDHLILFAAAHEIALKHVFMWSAVYTMM